MYHSSTDKLESLIIPSVGKNDGNVISEGGPPNGYWYTFGNNLATIQ